MFVALALIAAASVPPQLAPFQFLVGHCWRTTLKEGPTDTHCYVALDKGAGIRDRHTVRKDGQAIYSGEAIFSVKADRLHYQYRGSAGVHDEGLMHIVGDKIEFDDTDQSGSETFYRQVDSTHYEDVTHDAPGQQHFESRKVLELVEDEKP
jgi:hypothetical protein